MVLRLTLTDSVSRTAILNWSISLKLEILFILKDALNQTEHSCLVGAETSLREAQVQFECWYNDARTELWNNQFFHIEFPTVPTSGLHCW